MVNVNFNLPLKLMDEFRDLHKGEMSEIVAMLITEHLEVGRDTIKETAEVRKNIRDTEKDINKLTMKRNHLQTILSQINDEKNLKDEASIKDLQKAKSWSRDIISTHKINGNLADINLEAERAGVNNLEDYLISKYFDEVKK